MYFIFHRSFIPIFSIKLKLKMCFFYVVQVWTLHSNKNHYSRLVNKRNFLKLSPDYVNSLRLDINRGNSTPAFSSYILCLLQSTMKQILSSMYWFLLLHGEYFIKYYLRKHDFESLREISDISIDHKISLLNKMGLI